MGNPIWDAKMHRVRRKSVLFATFVISSVLLLYFLFSGQTDHLDPDNYDELAEAEAEDQPNSRNRTVVVDYQFWPNTDHKILKKHDKYGSFHITYNNNEFLPSQFTSTTIVTILTMEYIPIFKLFVENAASYPIICMAYIPSENYAYHLLEFKRKLLRSKPSNGFSNVRIHVVVGEKETYPANFIKNIAWDLVKSDWIILWEMPFVPATGFDFLNRFVSAQREIESKFAYVIPTFVSKCNSVGTQKINQTPWIYVTNEQQYIEDHTIVESADFFASFRCEIVKPTQLFSPIDYKAWFNQSVNSEYSAKVIKAANVPWGWEAPPVVVRTNSIRPSQHFASAQDGMLQHVIELLANDYYLFTIPFPIFAHRPHHQPRISLAEFRQLDGPFSDTLCTFRDKILERSLGVLDPICHYLSSDTLHLPCCNGTDRVPVPSFPVLGRFPNWQLFTKYLR